MLRKSSIFTNFEVSKFQIPEREENNEVIVKPAEAEPVSLEGKISLVQSDGHFMAVIHA